MKAMIRCSHHPIFCQSFVGNDANTSSYFQAHASTFGSRPM